MQGRRFSDKAQPRRGTSAIGAVCRLNNSKLLQLYSAGSPVIVPGVEEADPEDAVLLAAENPDRRLGRGGGRS